MLDTLSEDSSPRFQFPRAQVCPTKNSLKAGTSWLSKPCGCTDSCLFSAVVWQRSGFILSQYRWPVGITITGRISNSRSLSAVCVVFWSNGGGKSKNSCWCRHRNARGWIVKNLLQCSMPSCDLMGREWSTFVCRNTRWAMEVPCSKENAKVLDTSRQFTSTETSTIAWDNCGPRGTRVVKDSCRDNWVLEVRFSLLSVFDAFKTCWLKCSFLCVRPFRLWFVEYCSAAAARFLRSRRNLVSSSHHSDQHWCIRVVLDEPFNDNRRRGFLLKCRPLKCRRLECWPLKCFQLECHPTPTQMNTVISHQSKDGFFKNTDWTCTPLNIARTCGSFDSEGGSCRRLNAHPNSTISDHGSISGNSAMKNESFHCRPIACGSDVMSLLNWESGWKWHCPCHPDCWFARGLSCVPRLCSMSPSGAAVVAAFPGRSSIHCKTESRNGKRHNQDFPWKTKTANSRWF